jgi:hypothetical protein
MSMRGTRVPTTLYWLTGLIGAGVPGVVGEVPKPVPTLPVGTPAMNALKSLPPSRSLYLTLFPPPETTPSVTLSCEAATPSCVEARPRST